MNRLHVSQMLMALALLPVAALAVTPDHNGHSSAPAPVSGTFSITYNIDLSSTLPAGAMIICKTEIAPAPLSGEGTVLPIESAASVATVSGSTATCVVEIPFAWTLNAAPGKVVLNYEIVAQNASAALPVVVRSSSLQGVSESLPTSGATSALSFSVTF